VQDAGIFLNNGMIVLAGQLKDSGYVVSFHFEPKMTEAGKLHLRLAGSYGGALPVPQSMLNAQFEKLRTTLREKMRYWQQSAAMDARGANASAVAASLGKLLLSAMDDKPAEPVLFMPDENDRALPLRLVDIKVGEELMLTVQPMTPQQRAELLESIRAPVVGGD
jgi:hypothetical protein